MNTGRTDLHFLDVEILQPPDKDRPLRPESGIANHALKNQEQSRPCVPRSRSGVRRVPGHSHPHRVLGVVVPAIDTRYQLKPEALPASGIADVVRAETTRAHVRRVGDRD